MQYLPPSPPPGVTATGQRRPVVAPFARALSILAAFMAGDRWLSNSELACRTGLPASTVTRMTRTLVALGYLRGATDARGYCLCPSTLALGYQAATDAGMDSATHQRMRLFAEHHKVHVHLSVRDRLDLVVVDSCCTSAIPASLQLGVGARLGLESTAAGWALLASLPDAERSYLLRSAELRPAGGTAENRVRIHRRSSEAIGQVREDGFCVALGESGRPMTMVAAPVQWPGEAPLAVSCMGPSMLIGRSRSVRELGPALVRMAQDIQHARRQP